ncbi:NUDIX hydrolase [Pelobium manganitolerans]|uniref:NUDIX hydrolase n=1 Tax=Pelobium manganitolerans TaxID=1842495 RepID=A0A419S3U5_9SPHI|nr:NUDIX domain-containing protein [Pelobium manganitolerans]RKD14319.1 NUDIX hydrolase [Pelobium manganitolerans]
MAQKYNIYINEKALIITSKLPESASNYQLVELQGFDFEKFYHDLSKNPKSKFLLLSDEPKAVFQSIKKKVRVIEAAGGLVRNEDGKYLFIHRHGRWDLPKGKLEADEKKKDAAVREVQEECGIKVKKLRQKIIKTYHVYEIKGKPVLKVSHWYAMDAKGKQKLIPQLEEGISEVKWFAKNEFNVVRANTFANILQVIDCAS